VAYPEDVSTRKADMTRAQESLAAAAYALFALEQPLGLPELAAAAPAGRFPLAATQTPEWFAAAASGGYNLHDVAPELQVLSGDLEGADRVDVSGIDLIHVYAPELQSIEDLEEEPEPVAPPVPAAAAEKPRTSTQLGLLKELGNLDA
jgi:hypothetical protein